MVVALQQRPKWQTLLMGSRLRDEFEEHLAHVDGFMSDLQLHLQSEILHVVQNIQAENVRLRVERQQNQQNAQQRQQAQVQSQMLSDRDYRR
eukprot:CAMPEP_0182463148 /NCGR_PEP_ID=MMETSP1319-20130603/7171_1 /TAXON_ID=172717 /ORGANISM="Bolidomonas pacifica, Strain RCC208" /LENGTH=91 /DNA_ID=CAMNT_0024662655 /DNA_START=51 /DNA_END=323 /DNA_ORIENTATION=-